MRVRLSDADYLPRLERSLRAAGCVPFKLDGETIHVAHPEAADPVEAEVELHFFVRAWQLEHPAVEALVLTGLEHL
ncbi:MAG TPA: hypothetical protein VH416_02815 [Gaiellaceae bacterium]|jgi:hypothetical protein